MSDFLFSEFDEVSSQQWKQKIQADLKGVDYQTLIWHSPEGIDVKPFYHADEFPDGFLPVPDFPTQWSISQSIFIDQVAVAQKLAVDSLQRGAESIWFTANQPFDIEKLTHAWPSTVSHVFFELDFLYIEFTTSLIQYFKTLNIPVFLLNDPISHLAKTGNWFQNLEQDMQSVQQQLQLASDTAHLLSVDATSYQNAGANCVQQLAYTLAHANEYLNRLSIEENPALANRLLTIQVAVGGNYFFEIAKLRALRILWAALASEYQLSTKLHILAVPSKRNKTLYDYNVNMLRTTTECMSAVLGGANSVSNLPYDVLYHKSNEFGERIARNQLLILKHESYLDQPHQAAQGAYYIESLTQKMAEKALQLFKDIEQAGGFLKQLKEGIIQKKIKESASKEQSLFDQNQKKLIGTNQYINPQDRMKPELELYPFVKTNPRKTLIEPIIEKRLAEKIEQERLATEA